MPDQSPRTIGGYEVLEQLGKGGMGTVFKVRQVSMDRFVALKVLPPRLAGDESYVARFVREARAAAKLTHPNIVQGYDVGEADGHHYFAMELADGPSVKDLLDRSGPIAEKKALNIVGAVARALEEAHRHGIVHRDIKPDNIMINSRGIVKLADLGLARTTAKVDTVTLDGTAIGTPQYMSPEQVRALPDLDTRADIYALGATLYHMLTGRVPFDGPTPAAIIAKQVSEPVPQADGASRAANDLIQVMMAKERDERPQTPAQLLHMIKDALAGKATSRPIQSAVTKPMAARKSHAVHRRVHAKKQGNPLVWVGIGLVAVAAIGIFFATRGGGKPEPQDPVKVVDKGHQPDPVPPPKGKGKPPTKKGKTPVVATTKDKAAQPDPEKQETALRAKWDAIKGQAAKLAGEGKFDEAEKALVSAKTIGLDNIADLIAAETAAVEAARKNAADAAARLLAAAYAVESNKVWVLFKERKYGDADALLANLKDQNGGDAYQADLEAAKLLKEFWGRVEKWVIARKGKFLSIAGAGGNVASVKDGVVTIVRGTASFTRRIDQLATKQALAYADLKDDKRSYLLKGVFLLAEGTQLTEARGALAAAGSTAYGARLDGRGEAGVPVKPPEVPKHGKWVSLFEGERAKQWKRIKEFPGFKSGGTIETKDGRMALKAAGKGLTGAAWGGDFPTSDYEMELTAVCAGESTRLCYLIFPVDESRCMLVFKGEESGLMLVDGKSYRENPAYRESNVETRR